MGPSASVQVSAGAVRIDGNGKYLMPGLADMHVHPDSTEELMLFVVNGVTTPEQARKAVAAHKEAGVMVRGRWIPREEIQSILQLLAAQYELEKTAAPAPSSRPDPSRRASGD